MITDEMVEAAIKAAKETFYAGNPADKHTQMRAALEAALGARTRNAPEIVLNLRKWGDCLNIPSGPFVNEDCKCAAACIEDIAEALRENEFVATTGPLTTDGYKNALEQVKKRARAALERWGLK